MFLFFIIIIITDMLVSCCLRVIACSIKQKNRGRGKKTLQNCDISDYVIPQFLKKTVKKTGG